MLAIGCTLRQGRKSRMHFTGRRLAVLLATAYLSGVAAYGSVIYDENASGDLSDSGLSPTLLTVSVGSSQIFGVTGNRTGFDRDYFTITVPTGAVLTSIVLLPGTVSLGPEGESIIGIQSG